ncbi:hypothetical protein RFI_00451 [Reticulomyxa filosa]|uniref:Uncharacterized protein n=1 Tax=Reticulomyxa filosa TaxID=46433 RepID=X6PEY5_RETFI|nr:hypothetical protein RFI_00451 [Reticulomyxa filosa]|eukprot:ETO36609.1 hypothetical protein RFI_00451 [Reticulomyxa filosa]
MIKRNETNFEQKQTKSAKLHTIRNQALSLQCTVEQEVKCVICQRTDFFKVLPQGMIVTYTMIIVHDSKQFKKYKKMLKLSLKTALETHGKTKDTLYSLVEAIKVMENDELVNAGKGANLTLTGTTECESAVYHVNTQDWAAITAVQNVINPVFGAYKLLQKSSNVSSPLSLGRIQPIFLSGHGAEQWCKDENVPIFADTDEGHKTLKSEQLWKTYTSLAKYEGSETKNHDTCGGIAFDLNTKQMYVATSSGGIFLKTPGLIEIHKQINKYYLFIYLFTYMLI